MASPVVDISMFGDKALARGLARLEPRIQKKVVRQAIRKSAKRVRAHVIANWERTKDTGQMAEAFKAIKIRAGKRSRHGLRMEYPLPERSLLGISPSYKWYPPFAVEYGYTRTARAPVTVPPKAPIRRAVNEHTDQEHAIMGREIGKGIEREARKAFKK